jgi:hypothetical protein
MRCYPVCPLQLSFSFFEIEWTSWWMIEKLLGEDFLWLEDLCVLLWWIGPDVVDYWKEAHFELKEAKERKKRGKIEYSS